MILFTAKSVQCVLRRASYSGNAADCARLLRRALPRVHPTQQGSGAPRYGRCGQGSSPALFAPSLAVPRPARCREAAVGILGWCLRIRPKSAVILASPAHATGKYGDGKYGDRIRIAFEIASIRIPSPYFDCHQVFGRLAVEIAAHRNTPESQLVR